MPTLWDFARDDFRRDPPAKAHDPITSFQAAEKIRKSGRMGEKAAACLSVVRRFPNRTTAEMAEEQDEIGRYDLARYMTVLERRELVRRLPPRICEVTGNNSLTWEPIESETQERTGKS